MMQVEFLGDTLETRRSTVTLVLGVLQRSGLIEHSRGQVSILGRESLEGSACECYGVTRRLFSICTNSFQRTRGATILSRRKLALRARSRCTVSN